MHSLILSCFKALLHVSSLDNWPICGSGDYWSASGLLQRANQSGWWQWWESNIPWQIIYYTHKQCSVPFKGGLVIKVSLNCEAITWSVHLYVCLFGRGAVNLSMILALDLISNYISQPLNNSIIHEYHLHLHLHLFSLQALF